MRIISGAGKWIRAFRLGGDKLFLRLYNKNIKADYSILDAKEGDVLWAINYSCQANWQQQSDQIIERINHRFVRHFPYKID